MNISIVLKKGGKTITEECSVEELPNKVDAWIEEAKRIECKGIALTVLLFGNEPVSAR